MAVAEILSPADSVLVTVAGRWLIHRSRLAERDRGSIIPAMARTVDLADVARRDGRYDPEAFRLVAAGLRRAAERTGKAGPERADRHLSAAELVDGVIDLAAERWSLLAGPLLRNWGICRADDIGVITFVLIDNEIFSKRPEDRIEDFALPDALDERVRRHVSVRLRHGLGVASAEADG